MENGSRTSLGNEKGGKEVEGKRKNEFNGHRGGRDRFSLMNNGW